MGWIGDWWWFSATRRRPPWVNQVEKMLEESKHRADEPSLLTDDRHELQELYQLTADQNAVLTRQAQVLKEQLGKTEVRSLPDDVCPNDV